MFLPNPLLEIDTRRAAEGITEYIKKIVTDESAKGVVIALSGSLDSAVLATLAIRALGKKAVDVYYPYDRHSPAESMQKASLWAHRFSLNLKFFDIEPAMRKKLVTIRNTCDKWQPFTQLRPGGLEPPAFGLGNRCSILLSYGRFIF